MPKTICIPCDLKLEQHHRFIQRVIQNQKKIVNPPIIARSHDIPTVATDDDNTENDEQTESDESEVEDINNGAIFANRNGSFYNQNNEQ